jgi:hypothetical protein
MMRWEVNGYAEPDEFVQTTIGQPAKVTRRTV